MYTRRVEDPAARALRLVSAPALVVGAPRSGTTLVQRLLLADPRCVGGQESHFLATFGQALRDFDRKQSLPRPHGLACYWTRAALVAEIRGLWSRTFVPVVERRPGAEVFVEKTPDHALWLDVAAELTPAARVVHVVRDARAVVASLLSASRAPWGRPWAPRSAEAAVTIWRRHMEAALASPLPVHLVRYEDIVDGAPGAVDGLFRFLGLAPEGRIGGGPPAPERSTDAFVSTGELRSLPSEPEGFARPAAEARDAWRRELGWWDERRVWRATADLMEPLGYGRAGKERAR